MPAEQHVDPVLGHHPATSQHGDPVGHVLHLVEHVRRQEDGATGIGGLAGHHAERLLHEGIEATGRLVEHQQVGFVHERVDHRDLAPVAERQLAHRSVEVGTEPIGELADLVTERATADRGVVLEVVTPAQPGGEVDVARQVADAGAQFDAVTTGVEAEHGRRARRGPQQIEQQPDRGGLPGPVGSEEAEHLADAHVELEPVERERVAEPLRQRSGGDRRRRARRSSRHSRGGVHAVTVLLDRTGGDGHWSRRVTTPRVARGRDGGEGWDGPADRTVSGPAGEVRPRRGRCGGGCRTRRGRRHRPGRRRTAPACPNRHRWPASSGWWW